MALLQDQPVPVRSVSVDPEPTALIDTMVASDQYHSASKAVRAALRLLAQQDRLDSPRPLPDKATRHAQPRS